MNTLSEIKEISLSGKEYLLKSGVNISGDMAEAFPISSELVFNIDLEELSNEIRLRT